MTMPQFRVLGYLRRHPRASLNDVAEHLGMTAPSASKLVQKLVAERIVARRVGADRRRVCLSLTQNGISALAAARAETRENLANSLKALSQEDLAAVGAALKILGEAFTQGGGNVDLH
jgi:DNA-binding MarR family transcriptional regulator